MSFHQAECQQHADTCSGDALVNGIFSTEEALEHLLLFIGRNADAGITDAQLPFSRQCADSDVDLTAFWSIFQGIAQQVVQDRVYLVLVYPNVQWLAGGSDVQLNMLLLGKSQEGDNKLLHVAVQFAGCHADVGGISLFLLELNQLGSQFGEAVRVADSVL